MGEVPTPHHERIDDPALRTAVGLLDGGDAEGLREFLDGHPGLTRRRARFDWNYFQEPSLLEFCAENPVRHGRLPENIVACVGVVLEADGGPEQASLDSALMLVCSGRVPRECGVQTALIDVLCDAGARPGAAMLPALAHGEFDAAAALLARGAEVDLPVAAALGRVEEAKRNLTAASPGQRHSAFALAALHGHFEIVEMLLDAGQDPSAYNPPGIHAHSTALHQAVCYGHLAVVRLLVERGASLEARDRAFQATPLQWAEHGSRDDAAALLRARGAES